MTVKRGAKLDKAKKVLKKTIGKAKSTSSELRLKPVVEKQTKSEIFKAIADTTNLTIKQVKEVFLATSHLAKCHLIKKGSGEFAVPEMSIKIVRRTKPATKKRAGRNPSTGEMIEIAARPKRDVIKVRLLKALKEVLN